MQKFNERGKRVPLNNSIGSNTSKNTLEYLKIINKNVYRAEKMGNENKNKEKILHTKLFKNYLWHSKRCGQYTSDEGQETKGARAGRWLLIN